MVNVSLPVAFGSTPIEADWAMSVPSSVTVAPLEASLVLAVIVIGEVAAASIVEPDAMSTLLPAVSVTDEPDWMVTPLIVIGPRLCSVTEFVELIEFVQLMPAAPVALEMLTGPFTFRLVPSC